MSEYRKSLLLGAAFCLLIAGLIGYYLHYSYQQEKRAVEDRVSRTSHLISEWVKGAFLASDYVLRDIISQVPLSEVRYPHPDPVRQARVTDLLIAKVNTLPFATGVALADKDCTITHVWNMPPRPSIVGFEGKHRDWCKFPQANPQLEAFVSNSGMSLTNKLVVWQMRQYPGRTNELKGLAGITVEFDFFSKWLEQVSVDDHGLVAILDMNLNLLARKPALPDALGKKVNDPDTAAVIASGERYRSLDIHSPLDGENRLHGVRKLDGLPFVVVVGEANQDWQRGWRQRTWGALAALLLLWGMAALVLRHHWAILRQRELIRQNRDQLEVMVADRTADLALEKEKAEAANIAKSAFLANMSHEMRTPLNHILGMAALIRREPMTPKQTDRLAILDSAGHNLAALVDTVLELTHIEAGKFELVEEAFSLDELVQEVVSVARDQANARGLNLSVDGINEPVKVLGDRQHIHQALHNYVSNALRFTETGGITIRTMVTPNVSQTVMVRFEVEDTGIGIAPEDQKRLFSLFEQVDNSSTRKYGGLGVGLAMTKKIAQIMGGDAGCNSKLGAGSTFWFTVKLKTA